MYARMRPDDKPIETLCGLFIWMVNTANPLRTNGRTTSKSFRARTPSGNGAITRTWMTSLFDG
uniref:Uncharacterized protein n=1 Tax=Kwoniella dejecticola CBS 10117 TaxID=1296121 RepID=A0A1A5ZU89_9TREE|nr:uncharacterized protein I303_08144 [Kwoniella dejecticola CBS 10117]OBR81374.1 hypothetical protein I303_08144 [Kwoniella dejecticola CBS 10117]